MLVGPESRPVPEFPAEGEIMAKWARSPQPMLDDSCLICARRTVAARWNMSASVLCLTTFLLAVSSVGTAGTIPVPRERPEVVSGEQSPTPETAIAPSPPITGPGECAATDVVKVDAVLLPDKHRVALSPPVILRCPMAEAVAQWITSDVAPTIAAVGTPLRSIESLDSFDCRPRNGIAGAQLSEHGH